LVAYVLWILRQADRLGLERLCFLSRDGQGLCRIAQRLAPRLGIAVEVGYVHSSRRTWSLAAADPSNLAGQEWLFNSHIRANADDVLARLGLPDADGSYLRMMAEVGVSLNPDVRADDPAQLDALHRFTGLPAVSAAVAPRIAELRSLVRDYAEQSGLTSTRTGLVDSGWTGRMIGALTTITSGLPQPQVFFWGHEPRATGWSQPDRISAYMYSTEGDTSSGYRVPDTPYIIETFCMSDHGIVSDYRRVDDSVSAVWEERNHAVVSWGLTTFRATVDSLCDALKAEPQLLAADFRPVVAALLREFWTEPSVAEARAWGRYPYDSDPLALSVRPLAGPLDQKHLDAVLVGADLMLGERAWLQGSLTLSGQSGRRVAKLLRPEYDKLGAPATD
jgi:hypothetical protein